MSPEPSSPIHIIPLDDLREHTTTADCWCHPVLDEEYGFYTHNSMDGRELYETGEKELS